MQFKARFFKKFMLFHPVFQLLHTLWHYIADHTEYSIAPVMSIECEGRDISHKNWTDIDCISEVLPEEKDRTKAQAISGSTSRSTDEQQIFYLVSTKLKYIRRDEPQRCSYKLVFIVSFERGTAQL